MERDLSTALLCLVHEIHGLTAQLKNEFAWRKSLGELATKADLHATERRIMSAISDLSAKVTAFFNSQGQSIDGIVASVTGLTGDIQSLNDKIAELQNSAGGVTPEDQALIDAMETQADGITQRLDGINQALAALDALTPPAVTPPPAPASAPAPTPTT